MEQNTLMLKQNGDNHNYSYAVTTGYSIQDFGVVEDLHSLMEVIEENEIKALQTENTELEVK